MQRSFLRASVIAALFAPLVWQTAAATDIPIPGKVTVAKSGKLAKLVAKSATGFPLPSPGSAEDPSAAGAQLSFFDTSEPGAGQATFVLDASGWKGLGSPPGARGYKYKGKDDTTDPDPKGTCKIVLLKEKVIKAVCKGAAVSLQTPFSASEGITLGVPAGSASSVYCAELGGTEAKNDAKLMKRKDAAAPPSCPAPGSSFTGFDPNDVAFLADDALQGRQNDTPGSTAAQDYLIGELKKIAVGLNSGQSGDDAFKQPFTLGTNLLAVIPGSELPDEYVIVGAHYDHLGSSCRILEVGDTVCNGATDNAAGVGAVLAVGRAIHSLPAPPRRSVILALWDREEDGLLGSAYYVAHPLVPLADTTAYVNFDIQGANLLPSLKSISFAIAAETGGATLQAAVDAAVAGKGLDTRKLSFIFGQGRSDYLNFVNSAIPSVFFSDATGACYHTNQDEVGVVDFAKLEKQGKIAFRLVRSLADTATPPSFSAPSAALATFEDAVVLNDVIDAGVADLSLFSAADQATVLQVQADLNAIVADGPGNFDSGDVTTLLLSALDVLDVLTRIPCDGFL